MNYYSHHIGDFNNATRHLTRVERSLYRDAIELYYDTESALTLDFDKLARRLLANDSDEKASLLDVLNEFFNKTDDGWTHDRCEEEIAKYRANTSNKAKAGIASALKRKQKATGVEQVLNTSYTGEQLTNNQEPITNNHINTLVSNKVANCPYDQIVSNFNNALSMLPSVKQITDKRKKAILARWKEDEKRQSLEWWESFFGYVAKSDFLTGRSGAWSACCFDWIFKSENFVKIIEGNYENKA